MRLLVGLLLFLGLAGPALALCEGSDLIAELPAETRASLDAAVAETPYPEGLLWQATRGDTRLTIFGTYHIRHKRTEAHANALAPVIARADAAYFEMNRDDKARTQRAFGSDPSLMFITQGPTLPDLLSEAEWQLFKTQMEARGFPSFMAAKMKPIWGSMMLGIGPCQARSGALDAEGIDMALAESAATQGVPDLSLEDWRTVMTLTDGYDMDEQLEMLRLSFAFADHADDLQHTLLQRYLSGEIALLWEYSRLLSVEQGGKTAVEEFAQFEDILLTQRNRAWVELLQEQSGDIFIAAGAAHLPGENGVLQLLEQQGFDIAPLPFDP
ncbi:TraB/GumN family protein [Lutimaribacter sp. EGI FJ00015]|uniref:TraB/GumN family protein n=1 Tax=Lutimaribacter degradans TaxID=2945989 RepID=A0ACC5ZZA3_9RHOB|nr:TraB/GumN family protein [Lutimaribacter sp. EGI FJ00013]MCM2562679.1 TraB/GumN family protein [Lutimaribacter sp. EGI FJ00013]MCO0613836.1 TraB/GumN family protein [Lutimaribacter sp. EGI FJ00015]MCO0636681.1 TraB/GumN family protein [Lutimaribacter sp. EGI FJ00014]